MGVGVSCGPWAVPTPTRAFVNPLLATAQVPRRPSWFAPALGRKGERPSGG